MAFIAGLDDRLRLIAPSALGVQTTLNSALAIAGSSDSFCSLEMAFLLGWLWFSHRHQTKHLRAF
jgi:hypothetical protein